MTNEGLQMGDLVIDFLALVQQTGKLPLLGL
jgi:hypothetical protein